MPPNPNIKVVYRDSSRHSSGEQRGAGHYACVTGRVFNWLKCLGGIMHLTPTAECQISILIFEKKLWRWGLYLKSVKDPDNTFKLAKSGQELCRPWYIFHGIFIETPPPQFFFKYHKVPRWNNAPQAHSRVWNINSDIWKKNVEEGVSINIP
jgi:hypothetical protein